MYISIKKMKICYVLTRIDEIGGAQIHVRDMACKMAEQGHEVSVISGARYDAQYLNVLKKQHITVYRVRRLIREINIINDSLALARIVKILCKKKPDLLSLHTSKAGFLGRVAGKICGLPVLFTAHGWSFSEGVSKKKVWFYILTEKIASYLVKRILNVCFSDNRLALKYGIAPAYKFRVIHNGMADIVIGLLAEPEKDPCRIVMTARFAPPKDHRLLLSVLESLKETQWHVDLIGTGPLEGNIKKYVSLLGLQTRVTFYGQTHKVAEILSRAQIFVLTTNWEGLPRSIIEALRAGLPVIASNVGGISELVENEKNGYLIPRADGRKLSEYLRVLLSDPLKRARMGKESRKKYVRGFTFETMYEKTINVYRELTCF
jgi:glycosyltransferase involved in cell wall biosynthesis